MLGVPPEADNGELRAAFRTLAKAFHPDVAGRGADTDGVFQLVKTAYGVLSHPQSRSMYDAGRSLFGNSSAFGDFTGFSATLIHPFRPSFTLVPFRAQYPKATARFKPAHSRQACR